METKHSSNRRNNNNFKFNDDTSTHSNNDDRDDNRCRKPSHNHLWKHCPDNRNSKNCKGGDNRQRWDARCQDGFQDDGGWHERHHNNNDDDNRNRDRNRDRHGDRSTRSRDWESRQSHRQEVSSTETRSVYSSLGTPFVSFWPSSGLHQQGFQAI